MYVGKRFVMAIIISGTLLSASEIGLVAAIQQGGVAPPTLDGRYGLIHIMA